MPVYAPAFHTTSTRTAKTDLEPVDPEAILEHVRSLPVYTWHFRDVDDGRHVGPMAEDFHEAFELDQPGDTIASVDADGIAMAAIQGLLARQECEHQRLADVVAERRERVAELESRVQALEATVNEQ
ncbi:MAG: tail fiber domain-containing protein [Natrialbaceae archaeon]|nr:tail fiber domain-containing protein [Natrialbaceae archaeon]